MARVIGLQSPVKGKHEIYDGVDPFAHVFVLLKARGVDHVEASRVAHGVVDHDRLAVQPQVKATVRGAEKAYGKGGQEVNPRIAEILGRGALQETVSADVVNEHFADDAAAGGVKKGVRDFGDETSVLPDVKLHGDGRLGLSDVGGDAP